MKHLLTIIAFMSLCLGFSQTTLRKSSLSTGGGSASSGNLYMIYAIGEIGVQESTVTNTLLSEGFVGPDLTAILGIEDYGVLQGLKLYPNPVKDQLHIDLPDDMTYEVHIFDLTGKEVFTNRIENNHQAQYNVSNLKTGLYLLVVIDRKNKQSATVKLQKL